MPKITLSVRTDVVGSTCTDSFEIEQEHWDEMRPLEKEKFMFECLCDSGMFEWWWDED